MVLVVVGGSLLIGQRMDSLAVGPKKEYLRRKRGHKTVTCAGSHLMVKGSEACAVRKQMSKSVDWGFLQSVNYLLVPITSAAGTDANDNSCSVPSGFSQFLEHQTFCSWPWQRW